MRKFSPGDKVTIRGQSDRIGIVAGESREARPGKWVYPVSFDPREPFSYYPEEALLKFEEFKSVEDLIRGEVFADAKTFVRSITYRKLERPLADNLYTFYSSRTEFQVHQFKPVIKFLQSPHQRLLLGDEVGLGKTIEAGIIITEQQARVGELARVLVVCPAMLRNKWRLEFWRRFRQEFDVLDRQGFSAFLERYAEYGEAERLRAICSIQGVRANRVINRLRELRPHFDVVIVDEAHYLRNPETVSHELGEVLGELADAVLFLSATPLQLGTSDLFTLLNLLVPGEFTDPVIFQSLLEPNEYINNALRLLRDPLKAADMLRRVETTSQRDRFAKNPFYKEALSVLEKNSKLTRGQAIEVQKLLIDLSTISHVFSRTKKRDVATKFPKREAGVVTVQFTQAEQEFYDAVTDFCASRFSARATGTQGISFAVIMPQRQVASCIPAMRERLDEIVRQGRVRGPTADDGDLISPEADEGESWDLDKSEIAALERLRQAAQKVGETDTKFDAFLGALRRLDKESPGSKIIVFSFFKATLAYLKRRLDATEYRGQVRLIHGDIHDKERQKIIANFRTHSDIKILLSSEVAGEGLDFEFCNIIFNYDLPWNPMRVEQRIGRLDRYGQQHEKILIFNFSMLGTIDDEILNRLYRRIGIFERYIGDLEAILGDQIAQLTREMFSTQLTPEERARMIDKVAENIERRKRELEAFEQESARFIGQDEYFDREITRVLETKRFITAAEVEHLLRTFIAQQYPNTTLLPPKSGRSGVYVLKADDGFRRLVWRYTEREDVRSRLDRELSNPYLVTFDSAVACQDETLGFITLHHPIIRAVKRFYDEYPDLVATTSRIALSGGKAHSGSYLFLIYLLEKAGLKTDLEMVPVLVNTVDGKVSMLNDPVAEWFMAQLPNATDQAALTASTRNQGIDRMIDQAMEYVSLLREEEEDKLKRRNEALIQNQMESLRQACELKVEKAKETIAKLRQDGHGVDSPIIRLHQGRIRNLEMALEERLRSLDAKRSASVGFRLIAGGLVEIRA